MIPVLRTSMKAFPLLLTPSRPRMEASRLFPYTTLFRSIAVDAAGNAYVTGNTFSADDPSTPDVNEGFPTTPDAFQTAYGGEQTLSLHDALPIYRRGRSGQCLCDGQHLLGR